MDSFWYRCHVCGKLRFVAYMSAYRVNVPRSDFNVCRVCAYDPNLEGLINYPGDVVEPFDYDLEEENWM